MIMNTKIERENQKITTNLYQIIESVEEQLKAEETGLLSSIVLHLIDSGKIRLSCETKSCRSLWN
jgi:hypothetical protein